MTARTATDKRPVSLTKRQWHLIVREWEDNDYSESSFASVMSRAVPAIVAKCHEVKSPDDIVRVTGSLTDWVVVDLFCVRPEALRWNVQGDIEKQLRIDSHGG